MAKIDRKTKLKLKKKSVRIPTKPTADKKPKKYVAADSLTWKPVKTSSFSGIDGGGGMMMLEELEDVGIEWEEADGGRKVAKFVEVESKMSKGKKKAAQEEPEQEGQDDEKASSASETEKAKEADGKKAIEEDDGEEFPDFAGFAEEDLNAADEEEHPNLDDEPAFNGTYMFDEIASADSSQMIFSRNGLLFPFIPLSSVLFLHPASPLLLPSNLEPFPLELPVETSLASPKPVPVKHSPILYPSSIISLPNANGKLASSAPCPL